MALDVICSHFDMVVRWPPRRILSGLFWWVCFNISKYAPKPSTNMQFQTNFDHWGCSSLVSLFQIVSGLPSLPSAFSIHVYGFTALQMLSHIRSLVELRANFGPIKVYTLLSFIIDHLFIIKYFITLLYHFDNSSVGVSNTNLC